MKAIDLKELNLDNLAIWPLPIKAGIIAVCCFLILVLGYLFGISPLFDQLHSAKRQESVLQIEFQTKESIAGSLPLYQKQLEQIQLTLAGMVKQLPNSTEIPNLLEEISKIGVTNGLQFNLFKPLPEKDAGFFNELPIQISVVGNYHQLGQFITQVADLNRIVTLADFDIEPDKAKPGATQPEVAEPGDERLVMNITATTYRYGDVAATTAKDPKAAAAKAKTKTRAKTTTSTSSKQ